MSVVRVKCILEEYVPTDGAEKKKGFTFSLFEDSGAVLRSVSEWSV